MWTHAKRYYEQDVKRSEPVVKNMLHMCEKEMKQIERRNNS